MNAGWGLLQSVVTVFSYVLALRFALQAVRADFYNPVSQYVLKFSDPVCGPVRKVWPSRGRFDGASLLLLCLVHLVFIGIYFNSAGDTSVIKIVAFAGFNISNVFLNMYFAALIIMVIMSWLMVANPAAGQNPIYLITHQLIEPIAAPLRRIIPPIGGLDLSVLVLFLGIQFAKGLNGQFWSLWVK